LSEDNKNRRHDIALILLSKFREKELLHNIITSDEKRILHDNIKCRQSWIDSVQPSISTPNPNIQVKNVLLCIWWNWKGMSYYNLLQPGYIITADRYEQHLANLSDAFEEKRSFTDQGHRKVILLHDNEVRLHVAKAIQDHIFALG